jgi:nucleoside-triphosphatase THEP1
MIYILTGEINSGKTTALSSWVDLWRREGGVIGGILAPALWLQGLKVSYDVQDILTGKRCLLASREPLENAELFGDFWFSNEALAFGEKLLLGLDAETQIGVVDELGPLELAGRGWARAFRSLLSHPPENLIVVVRESLVKDVREAFSLPETAVLLWTSECPFRIRTPISNNKRSTINYYHPEP